MKNLFRKKGSIKKPSKNIAGKNIRLPYSGSKKSSSNQGERYDPDPKKTQVGRQPDYSQFPPDSSGTDIHDEVCPKCGYPLRIKPESSSPCPNCGYAGDAVKTVSDSGKTRPISSLEDNLQQFMFYLRREIDDTEIKIESEEEEEVILNRDHLDPENSTISGDQHAIFRFKDKNIFIEDVSSNGSTFIQAKIRMPLENGLRIVIGNKILVFTTNEIITQSDQTGSTRKIGDFSPGGSQPGSGFSLLDERTGKQQRFSETHVILNRTNLDPHNNTISGSRHAEIEYSGGQWYITDLSSNESTFVQFRSEQLLQNKMRLILGNRVFRFEHS